MSFTKIKLDTREFEHPIPMQMAIDKLQILDNNTYLYMIHTREPIPLLELAKERGLMTLTQKDTDNVWHILIAKNSEIDLNKLLDA